MDVHSEITCVLILLVFNKTMSKPSCIVYERNKDNGPKSTLPIHCSIDEIVCPWNVFSRREVIEDRLMVCLSDKEGSSMFTWPVQLKVPGVNRHMVLAIREHHFASGDDTTRCFNTSLPESVGGLVSVTAITELNHGWKNGTIAWMESALAYTDPVGQTIVLRGSTIFKDRGDNSCGSGEDQCSSWLRMKLNYSNPTCIGTLCRTIVDLSLRRHKMRAVEVELRVDATRTLCSGMMRHCVLVVDKLYGGRFLLQIRIVLPGNQVCAFSRTIPSIICGEPPVTHAPESPDIIPTTTPQSSISSTMVLLVIAIAVCLVALSIIGILVYKRIRRNGYSIVTRREPLNSQLSCPRTTEIESIDEQTHISPNNKTSQQELIDALVNEDKENSSLQMPILNDNGDEVI